MSHHIYQTDAFVIDSRDVGEANKIVYLFTKDIGMIAATAQGVRLLKSKLRYSLQDFSYSKVSLVRGKEVWRITSAGLKEKLLSKLSPDSFAFARALVLVKRLTPGEEKNERLFDSLYTASQFLLTRESDDIDPLVFECLLVLRILNHLGYLAPSETIKPFVTSDTWSGELIAQLAAHKKEALAEINHALKESQL
jgi:DNA repair protein RecO (recombination protein O)